MPNVAAALDVSLTPSDPPQGTLPISSAKELLSARRVHVNRIEELVSTTRPHFEQYYLAVLWRYAEWSQQLPASEAHHHAYQGGLLDHGLEVATAALRIRQGYLLPPSAPPEESVLKRALWTYAIFTLALLHDAAKPTVDQAITIFGEDLSTWAWNPWAGGLGTNPMARWYRVGFNRQRDYRNHQRAGLMLAPYFLGADGLAWLQSDPMLFGLWLAYASGDAAQAGVLAEIVSKADSESVGRSLGANPAPMAAKGGLVPLHEKLVTALRHLVDDGKMPVNRRGAVAYRAGDDLWMVSKSGMDLLRAYLLQTGHAGVPGDNSRLFDVLQDNGILVPTEEGKAVWTRVVAHSEGAKDTLTVLRIRVERLWQDLEAAPEPFNGTVDPVTEPSIATLDESRPVAGDTAEMMESIPKDDPRSDREESVMPVDAEFASNQTSAPRRAKGGNLPASPLGRDFLSWLISGVQSGLIKYNRPDARVHVVPEGLLLASPVIFRDYASQMMGGEDFKPVQKSFLKLKLHQENSAGLNTFPYVVAGSNAVIAGVLLANPSIVFGADIPETNPVLKRK